MVRRLCGLCAASMAMIAASGCGGGGYQPVLAPVTGTVTVDGTPGTELSVSFEPQAAADAKKGEVGQASSGRTDASGKFELVYPTGSKGAVVGKHKVRVTNIAGGGEAGGDNAVAPSVNIPTKYNTESQLTEEVKKGPNTINLDIKTK